MGARGEAYLTVDGQETPLLLTNRALANAERTIGRSILLVLREAASVALGINETAALLCEGLEQARREGRTRAQPYRMDEAWQVMDQVGYSNAMRAVMLALTAVLNYEPAAGDQPAEGVASDPPA
jgi:hypothetical protein